VKISCRSTPKATCRPIKLDDGSILTECAVVLQYIADQKPGSGLAPKAGTMERYRLQEWLNFISSELHKSFSPLLNKDEAEDTKNIARNNLNKRLAHAETQLAKNSLFDGRAFHRGGCVSVRGGRLEQARWL